jgi:RNA ligase
MDQLLTPFPSIGNVHNFIKEVNESNSGPRVLHLRGTVKLHGTHADIVARPQEGTVWYQSRNRVLSIDNDNAGCCRFLSDRRGIVDQLIVDIALKHPGCEQIMICGEYCGHKIQKGVALCNLPLMFVVFAIKVDFEWQHLNQYNLDLDANNIFSIEKAPIFTMTIDTANPQTAIDDMKALTDAVEQDCPFSASFDVHGGGEGIVWTCLELLSSRYFFKTKGASHMVSKVKTLQKETPEQEQELRSVSGFVDSALLEPRLEQGLCYLREMNLNVEMKNIGVFLKWVVEDIKKEEEDALQCLPLGKVQKEISNRAKVWYSTKCL